MTAEEAYGAARKYADKILGGVVDVSVDESNHSVTFTLQDGTTATLDFSDASLWNIVTIDNKTYLQLQ